MKFLRLSDISSADLDRIEVNKNIIDHCPVIIGKIQ